MTSPPVSALRATGQHSKLHLHHLHHSWSSHTRSEQHRSAPVPLWTRSLTLAFLFRSFNVTVNLFYVIDLMLLLKFHIHKKTSIFVIKQGNQSFLLHKTNNLSRLIFKSSFFCLTPSPVSNLCVRLFPNINKESLTHTWFCSVRNLFTYQFTDN